MEEPGTRPLEDISEQFALHSRILLDKHGVSQLQAEYHIETIQSIIDYARENPSEETRAFAERAVELFSGYTMHAVISDGRKHGRETHKKAATTDALTKLPNRAVYDRQIRSATREMAAPAKDGQQSYFALIVFDLDRFKGLNDDYGHLAG